MTESTILLLAVLVPALGALALPAVGVRSVSLRNLLAACLVLVAFLGSAWLIPTTVFGHQVVTADLFGLRLAADGLATFVAATSSLISFVIVLYSFGYVEHYDHQNEYYLMVVLFLGSMMGLVFSGNLLLLFTFFELTGLASWRLIGFFRKETDVLRANKAFLVTVFGALLMLLGFIMLYRQTGSFDLVVMKERLAGAPIDNLALFLILAGLFSKSATLPFHTWLPDAGVAPSPVTALLHAAVLVKIGVYVFARLFVAGFAYSELGHQVVLVVAAASALCSAGAALIDTDLKRIIAYSTVSQIAFIFLGLAAGTEMAVTGALLYILMHGLAKGGLFLCARHHRASDAHQGHHQARWALPQHADHRTLVLVLRALGDGHPSLRRLLQQEHGDDGRGRSWPPHHRRHLLVRGVSDHGLSATRLQSSVPGTRRDRAQSW
jgi:NADH:ubiquinone oxidoreductase subunit 5 (subunit L)/multisubunit Na+/H+ antiporter MnhA subunit